MLPRIYCLPAHSRLVKPTLYHAGYYTIRIAKNATPQSRFGFIVSKKVAKSAVARNTSRRKVRAGIEILVSRIIPGYDFLFILTKDVTEIPTKTLHADLEQLLAEKGYLQ